MLWAIKNIFFKRDILLSILSAVILIFAFPQSDCWFLAWFGLVPLMLALDGKSYRQSFGLSYLSGFIFFTGNLYWFVHVTKVGMFLMMLVLAVYYGLFGLVYRYFQKRNAVLKLILLPAGWVVIEFLRSRLFSGFDWVSLGHSQYKFLPIIQIADITGVFGVSFLLVMTNYAFKLVVDGAMNRRILSIIGIVLLFVFTYGMIRLRENFSQDHVTLAVVQGNIEQELKWEEGLWPAIMKKYQDITRQAAAEKPDLIIWPETSFPGFLWEDKDQYLELKEFIRELQVPLLFGTIVVENDEYFNDAVLVSREGEEVNHYHKIHLVPFGEYIPFRKQIPFLSEFVPIADFSPGKEETVFSLNGSKINTFSVLICFEDTLARLARKFVLNDARLLINITNDAWFGDTKAPYLHLQAAVFRTVENRRWLIRAANTGVSCFINEKGKVVRYLQNVQGKKTYVSGFDSQKVLLVAKKTVYSLYGDFFAYLCFVCILGDIIKSCIQSLNKK